MGAGVVVPLFTVLVQSDSAIARSGRVLRTFHADSRVICACGTTAEKNLNAGREREKRRMELARGPPRPGLAAALTADAEASDDGVDSWTQSLVRQALRSRWRGRCSVLNPEAWE